MSAWHERRETPMRHHRRPEPGYFSATPSPTTCNPVLMDLTTSFSASLSSLAWLTSSSAGSPSSSSTCEGSLDSSGPGGAGFRAGGMSLSLMGPPRVRRNPFFRPAGAARAAAEDILRNPPEVRPKTNLTKYKALPAIGTLHNENVVVPEAVDVLKQNGGGGDDDEDDEELSREGSPEMDEFMPFPDDVNNFGDDEDDGEEEELQDEALFMVHDSNLVPDIESQPRPPLVRRRTFEIIEPVDDELDRPVISDDDDENKGDSRDETQCDFDGVHDH
ncbi:unnamed protein product [Notodromas monacha]|uniref:Uncharacterized protein n=1 Tax=Notodromas monacha TaxID=399045 RepID=A0A7R9GHI6_9CRUS|nr:unnamed protein product [Notodromas monacha]CAG0922942.1 unnamed protein product [Notodromas monacha]